MANSEASAAEDASSFLTGGALSGAVAEMVSAGFDEDDVKRALAAAFNNPARAMDFLLSGVCWREGWGGGPGLTLNSVHSTHPTDMVHAIFFAALPCRPIL